MVVYLFLLVCTAMIWLQYKRENNIINIISLLVIPYMFVVLTNFAFLQKLGFYRITDRVLVMFLLSLICFFIGSCCVAPVKAPVILETDNESRFEKYNIQAMTRFVLVIGLICGAKALRLLMTGQFSGDNFEETEGLMGTGIVGHLLLISYSLLPIIFLYWIEHKKEILCLIVTIMIVLITFSTFVKYNVIGVVVTLFIFASIYKRSTIGKGVFILLLIVLLLFLGNYYLGFFLRNLRATSTFYMHHFWGYITGSAIYDDYIFDPGINVNVTLEYKLLTFIFAFPNMFIRKMTGGKGLFPHIKKPFLIIGEGAGQRGNVTDAFGYLFPAKGLLIDKTMYFVVLIIIGMLFTNIYMKAKRKKEYFNTFICSFITYFVFMSFFGTFYISPGPWEILLYSLTVPNLFLKSTDLRKGIIHLS